MRNYLNIPVFIFRVKHVTPTTVHIMVNVRVMEHVNVKKVGQATNANTAREDFCKFYYFYLRVSLYRA